MIKNKRVLILTSKGGTGQQSVCQAMHEHLSERYDLKDVNVTTDVMENFDPLSYLHKKFNTEVVYNWLIKRNYFFILNIFVWIGGFLMKYFLARKIRSAFNSIFIDMNPDIVISLVPYYNAYAIAEFDKNKPFIIVCCDVDIRGYLFNWPKVNYKNLSLFMPVRNQKSTQSLKKTHIKTEQTYAIGYPLRKAFYGKLNNNIPDNTISLLLGGQGSVKCLQYLNQLKKYKGDLTINACTGHNKELAAIINKRIFPKNIKINIISFTENISSILANSQLLIIKTGSCSVFEALSLQKPILMDCTSTQLNWERENIDYIKELGVGMPIMNLEDCVPILEKLLCSKRYSKPITEGYQKLTKNDFFKKFLKLLEEK